MSPTDPEVVGLSDAQPVVARERSRRLRRVLPAALLLLLLLLGCAIFWPVPHVALREESWRRGTRAGGRSLAISDPSCRVLEKVAVGRKARAVAIAFTAVPAEDTAFDADFVTLQLDGASLPPLRHSALATASGPPAVLRADRDHRIEVVFAVPKGLTEGVLEVHEPQLPPDQTTRLTLALPEEGETP